MHPLLSSVILLALLLVLAECGDYAVIKDKNLTSGDGTTSTSNDMSEKFEEIAKYLINKQEMDEESKRTAGQSGLKQLRLYEKFNDPNGPSAGSLHDHAHMKLTMGLGEMTMVMNGVEFRTRHNDYDLHQPSKTSHKLHATEEIQLPKVPPEVLYKPTLEEQILEMREWVRAWQEQNDTVRDYKMYFKPVLCYIEGAWFNADSVDLDLQTSHRHHVNAKDWDDLQSKCQYSSFSGRKEDMENLPFLPKKIIGLKNGKPLMVQWNYRVMCHPLKIDLPLNKFQMIDNLYYRLLKNISTIDQFKNSKFARFKLDETNLVEGKTLLDTLMEEIPGKNNYLTKHLPDRSFGRDALGYSKEKKNPYHLNTAFYHRYFKVHIKDGFKVRRRGYSDQSIFMAQTTQPNVSAIEMEQCSPFTNKEFSSPKDTSCKTYSQRWSYAVPLEIVYLTPLSNWNPYNIVHYGDVGSKTAEAVTHGGRNGGYDPSIAYNGTNTALMYTIPDQFFDADEYFPIQGDTTRNTTAVLGPDNEMKMVRGNGHRIFLPRVKGLSPIRQRYPIYPVYADDAHVNKELEALKDIIGKYDNINMD